MINFEHNLFGDNRGKLVAIEGAKDIPFDIKRVFYIFDVEAKTVRGQHAHYKCKQYLIALSGYCKVTLDDGNSNVTFDLDSPNVGLFQDSMVWGTMHDFSKDCRLLVLADKHYDEGDYIYDYKIFLNEAKSSRLTKVQL